MVNEIRGTSTKSIKSKELLEHILKTKSKDDLLRFFISTLDYEDVLNDYLYEFCDINNCFPAEEKDD